MPPIIGEALARTARLNFMGRAIVLPTDFNGFGTQAPFGARDLRAVDPNALFRSASTLNLHVLAAVEVGEGIGRLFDVAASAIGIGHANWLSGACFSGIVINGPVGVGGPGCLVGPPAMSGPALKANVGAHGGSAYFSRYLDSILDVFGAAFGEWQANLSVTLPFPAGAVCSGSLLPCANVPLPLASAPSTADVSMTAVSLKSRMVSAHGPGGMHAEAIFSAFAMSCESTFTQWKAATTISGVMGAGGVAPVFPAPPGPVVGAIAGGGVLV